MYLTHPKLSLAAVNSVLCCIHNTHLCTYCAVFTIHIYILCCIHNAHLHTVLYSQCTSTYCAVFTIHTYVLCCIHNTQPLPQWRLTAVQLLTLRWVTIERLFLGSSWTSCTVHAQTHTLQEWYSTCTATCTVLKAYLLHIPNKSVDIVRDLANLTKTNRRINVNTCNTHTHTHTHTHLPPDMYAHCCFPLPVVQNSPAALQETREDVREECEKFGPVRKIMVFDVSSGVQPGVGFTPGQVLATHSVLHSSGLCLTLQWAAMCQ